MYTSKWAKSKYTQAWQNFAAPNHSLYQKDKTKQKKNKKKSISGPSAKIKICTFSKAPPTAWQQSSIHAQNKWNIYLWICSGTTSIPVYKPKLSHIWPQKTAIWLYWFSRKNWHTPTETWAQFQKIQTRYAFQFTSSLVPRPLPDFILQPWRKAAR